MSVEGGRRHSQPLRHRPPSNPADPRCSASRAPGLRAGGRRFHRSADHPTKGALAMPAKCNAFRPRLEAMEDRLVPSHLPAITEIVVGVDRGAPEVKVFNDNLRQTAGFIAFDPTVTSGVRVGIGDVNDDGVNDYICGAGPGGRPEVKVIDGTKVNQVQANGQIANTALLADFIAFDPSVTSGVFVTAGDFDGDGKAEVAVSTGQGAAGQVRIFDIAGGRATQMAGPLGDFTPYGNDFLGGITLGAADFNRDGRDDLVTGTFRGDTRAKVFSSIINSIEFSVLRDFIAFPTSNVTGVNAAAGAVNGDG